MPQNPALSTQASTHLQTASPRELPTSTILTAIHSRESGDAAKILTRAHTCLSLYFDPDIEPETKAGMRESFVRALEAFPLWAVMKAFDAWERQHKRRPSPGEIATLARAEIEPFTRELERRKRLQAESRPQERPVVDKDRANAILEAAGFTPKRMAAIRSAPMAGSIAEAEASVGGGTLGPLTERARAALDADPAVLRARAE